MGTYDTVLKLVLNEDLEKIKEEMFNAYADDFGKNVDPIVAEKFRSKVPKVREEGLRMLHAMIEDKDSPDC